MCINKHCRGCKYYNQITEAVFYCSYLFQTNKRRPCPPGKGCTVREERRKGNGTKKERET